MSRADKPRLIEILMPLEQASILSPDEKYVSSGGYISTFHVWPARRPLAACRAALLATLLPDPDDPRKRAEMLKALGGEVKVEQRKSKDEDGNLVVEEKPTVEGGVLAWNAEDSEFMESLRRAILEANGGKPPQIFDPFAGGGAIPLEAMWLGCHASASDINPVAWLLLKGTLEYPQSYEGKKWPLPDFVNEWPEFVADLYSGRKKRRQGGVRYHFSDERQLYIHEAKKEYVNQELRKSGKEKPDSSSSFSGVPEFLIQSSSGVSADLPWHIRAWGRWVLERAQQELAKYFPVVNGEPTVAYFWARTVRDIQTEGRIPILKTFMLCRKKGKRIALLPIPDMAKKVVSFKLLTEEHLSTAERRVRVIEDHPFLRTWGVTEEKLNDFLKNGTRSKAGVWSPFEKGRPDLLALNVNEIREQGRRGLMGMQMTAVCVEAPIPGKTKTEKRYRLPSQDDLRCADVQIEEVEDVFHGVPYGIPNPDKPEPTGIVF
jgi:adenine-specific DNA methylase